jgi:excisionase family DNA binding protein
VRILIHEIVVDVNEKDHEVVLLIHWAGGRHSELRVKKNRTGEHTRCTSMDAIEVMRQMAIAHTDEQIAATLNRLGLQTGTGNSWNDQRVYSARRYHQLPAFDPSQASSFLTLEQTAERLGVSANSVRRMIQRKTLPASQVVPTAPWRIAVEALESDRVRQAVKNIKDGVRSPQAQTTTDQQIIFSAV